MGMRPHRKLTVEKCIRFSISSLTRAGVFCATPRTSCNSIWENSAEREILRIYFFWRVDVEGRSFLDLTEGKYGALSIPRETIEIVQTRLIHGYRYWFRCPGLGRRVACYRRAAILYLLPGGDRFACRKCHNLTYESVQRHDSRMDRLVRLPLVDLNHALETGTWKQRLLAVRACTERYRRSYRCLN
jgi:hypothetical protein